MPMDQDLHSVSQHCLPHGLLVDVHDFGRLALYGLHTLVPQTLCNSQTLPETQHPYRLLDPFAAYSGAVLLIGDVIGTQRVAMHDQCGLPVQVNDGFFLQDLAAGLAFENLADEKIPVSVDKINRNAGKTQLPDRFGDGPESRGRVIVTDPVLEQVSEYVQRVGALKPFEKTAKS